MSVCVITAPLIEFLIEVEWLNCLWFLEEVAKDNETDLETLIEELSIRKLTLEDVIHFCRDLFDEQIDARGVDGTLWAFSVILATHVLEYINDELKQTNNGSTGSEG